MEQHEKQSEVQNNKTLNSEKPKAEDSDEVVGEDEVVEIVDQDPGHRQKQNQNDQEEDPLAA
jgi:hypothetical protein